VRFAAELDAEVSVGSSHRSGGSGGSSASHGGGTPAAVPGLADHASYLQTDPLRTEHWHALWNLPVHAEAAQYAAYEVYHT
jgi:hypothetical protein